jgi:hypothetical protein
MDCGILEQKIHATGIFGTDSTSCIRKIGDNNPANSYLLSRLFSEEPKSAFHVVQGFSPGKYHHAWNFPG